MEGRAPEFAETFQTARKHPKKGKRNVIDYLVCNNLASMLWMINLTAIDFNPWSSTTVNPDYPDYITIDLDLDAPVEYFDRAIEVAMAAKDFFDDKELKAFAKTSGKTGIHLLLPCAGFNFEQARMLGSRICDEIHLKVSSITTRARLKKDRNDLLYVDDSQNDFADTIAAAYSIRPYHIPTVSTPLDWKEIKSGLDPTQFNINTIKDRIEKKGDLLKGLFDRKIAEANSEILKQFL
jgi:bifunctional non-homologous end joining protein LigD